MLVAKIVYHNCTWAALQKWFCLLGARWAGGTWWSGRVSTWRHLFVPTFSWNHAVPAGNVEIVWTVLISVWRGFCLLNLPSFTKQNNHPHGQPYTGPAAQHMNNPQRPGPASAPTPGPNQNPNQNPTLTTGTTPAPGPRAQENWESTEEVAPAPTTIPAAAPPKE